MSMKMWQIKYTWQGVKRIVRAKAGEDHVRHLGTELRCLTGITEFHKELRGYTDEPGEMTSGWITTLFSSDPTPVADQAGYEADVAALIARLPAEDSEIVLTNRQVQDFAADAKALFYKHLPIRDVRVDRDQKAADDAKYAALKVEQDAAQAARKAEFLSAWASSQTKVVIPAGMMAVTVALHFDDSHHQSDYFQPHSRIGWDLLLALVPEQARTERLARQVLERYPDLMARGPWKWEVTHTWGNFLECPVIGSIAKHAYDGRTEVEVWLEIEFTGGSYAEIYPYKEYKEPAYA